MAQSLTSADRFVIDPIPHLASVTAALWVPYGSRHEGGDLRGGSHLLEHVVTASESAFGDNCFRRVTALGGRTDAVTTPEFTVYAMTVPHTAWKEAWQLLESQFDTPDFSDSVVETQKLMVVDEIAGAESDAGRHIHAVALSEMLSGHGLGYPAVGRSDDIGERTPQDLRDVHRRQLHAAPRAIVSGNVDSADAADLLGASPLFAAEQAFAPPISPPPERPHARAGFEKTTVGSTRSHVLVSWFLPDRTPADDLPLALVNRLAGGAAGGSLQRVLHRSEGAYSSHTYRSVFSDCAVWSAYLSCSAQFTEAAAERIIRAIEQAWDTAMNDGEARQQASLALAGALAIGLESTRMRVNWIGRRLQDRMEIPEHLGSPTEGALVSGDALLALRERLVGPHVTIFEGKR